VDANVPKPPQGALDKASTNGTAIGPEFSSVITGGTKSLVGTIEKSPEGTIDIRENDPEFYIESSLKNDK
jgi:hypothetical protein